MKRIMLTVLAVLLVFSFAIPVLAQGTDHDCPHGNATIADLRACIDHAVTMGHIDNQGIARSLFAKLDAAQAALDRGQSNVAINILGALINAIGAQSGKHIDAQHASHMIEHTQQVIDALS
jgi:predicted outer membrane protein